MRPRSVTGIIIFTVLAIGWILQTRSARPADNPYQPFKEIGNLHDTNGRESYVYRMTDDHGCDIYIVENSNSSNDFISSVSVGKCLGQR